MKLIRWHRLIADEVGDPCQGAGCGRNADYFTEIKFGFTHFEILACVECAQSSALEMPAPVAPAARNFGRARARLPWTSFAAVVRSSIRAGKNPARV